MTNREVLWKPFTANREFNLAPKIFVESDGMYYTTDKGEKVLDAVSGLWCCNLGNNYPAVVEAIKEQAGKMYYSPAFQIGNELELELAKELVSITPEGLNHAFFTNSGSESVESALKMALAYQKAVGNSSKTMIIGREHAYHGVNFGGISVGGLVNNKRQYNNLIKVAHIPTILDIEKNAFSKGIPEHGLYRAEALLDTINLYGAENIAALIMEPMAGSAGVHIPPKGYLERISQICKDNDILLIFDEVITGFGRLGKAFASIKFGITPDIMTTAKGLTNGSIPMGAVVASDKVYDGIVNNSKTPIEFFHGYTYSGHPIACAAGIATLQTYKKENLFERVDSLAEFFEEQLHTLKDCKNVIDIRNIGLVGAIQMSSIPGKPSIRGTNVFEECFKRNLLVRSTGDTIALSPAYIVSKEQIVEIMTILKDVINSVE
jgi:beta-alanine--pyruvate transaminase